MIKTITLFLLTFCFILLGCEQKRKFLSVGDNAPRFSLLDLNGNTVSLNDLLKGKEVILNFWASWCPECRQQMPVLNEFAKRYNNKIEIVGINVGESKKLATNFTREIKVEYKILLDSKGEVARVYGVIGVPTNVLINKEGLIKNLNLDVRGTESYLRQNN